MWDVRWTSGVDEWAEVGDVGRGGMWDVCGRWWGFGGDGWGLIGVGGRGAWRLKSIRKR